MIYLEERQRGQLRQLEQTLAHVTDHIPPRAATPEAPPNAAGAEAL
ncbi:MAG: hypothetical protein HC767_01745 [Akkermansiaceae bacterium]|nr:hypothetical protein [Akkermansiaceae bacterium]